MNKKLQSTIIFSFWIGLIITFILYGFLFISYYAIAEHINTHSIQEGFLAVDIKWLLGIVSYIIGISSMFLIGRLKYKKLSNSELRSSHIMIKVLTTIVLIYYTITFVLTVFNIDY